MIAYKYILLDNQVDERDDYILSPRYYSSIESAREDINGKKTKYCFSRKNCFRVIAPLKRTKQIGQMAWTLTKHER